MPGFAKRMSKAKTSTIMQVADKARELSKQGRDIISFSIGVPNFLPAHHVYEAAHKAVDGDVGTYLPGRGTEELVKAFVARMADKGLPYSEKEVVVAVGGKHALFHLLFAMLNVGDEVIIPAPYWTSYPDMVEINDGTPKIVPCGPEQNYKLTPAQLEAAITPKTKALLFNNPNNPTGMVYTRDEIKALGDVLEKHDIWVISDDIYDRMIFDGEKFHHLLHTNPALRDRVACVQSISKNYGMPGWRVGMVAGPLPLIAKMLDLNSASITNVNNISMAAATAAFGGPQDFVQESMKSFETRRNIVVEALAHIPGVHCPRPQGAFYAFPDVSKYYGKTHQGEKITDDVALCNLLLERKGLAVVPGSAFGEPRGLRISYSCPEAQLRKGLQLLADFFAEVRKEAGEHAA